MQYLRIRTKKHEVIAAVGTCYFPAFRGLPSDPETQSHLNSTTISTIDNEFLVTVLQRWTPSSA